MPRTGLALLLALSGWFAGCGGTAAVNGTAPAVTAGSPATPAATTATAAGTVKITGTPATGVVAGQNYSFTPVVAYPASATARFSLFNAPVWAAFDPATGKLTGTPATAGSYAGILITVSIGNAMAALAPFTITVQSPAQGSVTLAWAAPALNTDGSLISNLAGYYVYYGSAANALTQSINISDPKATSYVIQSLPAGVYFFQVNAYNSAGIESQGSNLVSKVI